MSILNRNLMSSWIHGFTVLLLIGLLLSTNPAFAQTQAQASGSFAKHLPANSAKSQNLGAATNIVSLSGSNLLQDPSFEANTPNPYWSKSSTNNVSILCLVADCGTYAGSAPHTGSGWAWFGSVDFTEPGVISPEISDLWQNVTIPNCGAATLQFYFWIGKANSGSDVDDFFAAKVDDTAVFSANATQANSYPTYTLVSVDVSSYANGAVHKVEFYSNNSGQKVWFNLDDVSLAVSGNGCIFDDVPLTYWANNYIERLYNAGITGGCSIIPLNNYCPDSTVTRAQMAVFLLKGMHGPGFTPPDVGTSTGFTDVATSYWAAAWIKELAAEGITGGCGAGIYCPDATVTRAQMAVFLLKAKHTSSYSPPNATGVFMDVPMGYWADKWIEQLAVEGVTSGCGSGVYCPDVDVTRAQMAVFLVKTFNLP